MRRSGHVLRLVTTLALGSLLSGIVPHAAVATPSTLSGRGAPEVVQLGDSYSAGNGTGSYIEKSCWRSTVNYGQQVATALGASYANAACSGGVVADILNARALGDPSSRAKTYVIDPAAYPDPWAEWERRATADHLCGVPNQPDMYYALTVTGKVAVGTAYTATAQCQLMTEPQVDSVSPSTDYVFLTIGGNDLGFSSIVVQCMVLRDADGCSSVLDAATAKLPEMRARAAEALVAIHDRSRGHAQVYLLTYPFLLNTDSYGIPEAAPTFDAARGLRDLQVAGDATQAAIVADANARTPGSDFHLVDTVKAAWGGHAHGLDPHTVPDNSQAWLVPVAAPGREQPEWVHPTPSGWNATAGALRAAVAN